MLIRQATLADIDELLPLFEGYITFYRGKTDLPRFRDFLFRRLQNGEATVFIAFDVHGKGMGFTLLYPLFSSVSQARIFVLNDLFVAATYRGQGIATALMNKAAEFARSHGAIRLHLETESNNLEAQRLYEKLGWSRESGFYHYHISL